MVSSSVEIKKYYDQEVVGKIRDFVKGNLRVEKAWNTIENWAPESPKRILEVGCGIGSISWRMSYLWEKSEVVGIDISPKSIEVAKTLFGDSKVSFSRIENGLTVDSLSGKFDLIIFMDVYEHIPPESRFSVHKALNKLSSDDGRIIITVPTPRFQNWLKNYDPEKIQPVDEDISLETMQKLAQDTEKEILLYQDINVWREGDYAHVVLGKRNGWSKENVKIVSHRTHCNTLSLKTQIKGKILEKLGINSKLNTNSLVPSYLDRLALVRNKLGEEAYLDK